MQQKPIIIALVVVVLAAGLGAAWYSGALDRLLRPEDQKARALLELPERVGHENMTYQQQIDVLAARLQTTDHMIAGVEAPIDELELVTSGEFTVQPRDVNEHRVTWSLQREPADPWGRGTTLRARADDQTSIEPLLKTILDEWKLIASPAFAPDTVKRVTELIQITSDSCIAIGEGTFDPASLPDQIHVRTAEHHADEDDDDEQSKLDLYTTVGNTLFCTTVVHEIDVRRRRGRERRDVEWSIALEFWPAGPIPESETANEFEDQSQPESPPATQPAASTETAATGTQ